MSAEIDEAAARWHLAQADDDMNWAAFTEWLEADPRHREAYDAIALLDARIDAARPILSRLLPDESEPIRRRIPRVAWGAIAAVLIAVIAIGILRLQPGHAPETIVYRAPVGQSRDVRLANGSTATLAPGSVLRVAGSRDVPVTLDGNAFFDVRHDSAHPLVVQAGGYEIRDVGTRFEVSTSGGMLRVAVAEGRVAVRSPDVVGEVEIDAGKALTLTGAGDVADVRPARAQSVGAWRKGSLVYDDVPLAMVAADIARSTGRPVTVAPALARRRFSGVIAPGDREAMTAALSALTGLKARTDGDAIRLGDSAGR
jgi:transmembrane sensor